MFFKILPNENVVKAMRTVYEFNVQKFKNGESGAVNGMLPNGEVDLSSVQSQEVWTGVTYAVASHLILQVSRVSLFSPSFDAPSILSFGCFALR